MLIHARTFRFWQQSAWSSVSNVWYLGRHALLDTCLRSCWSSLLSGLRNPSTASDIHTETQYFTFSEFTLPWVTTKTSRKLFSERTSNIATFVLRKRVISRRFYLHKTSNVEEEVIWAWGRFRLVLWGAPPGGLGLHWTQVLAVAADERSLEWTKKVPDKRLFSVINSKVSCFLFVQILLTFSQK